MARLAASLKMALTRVYSWLVAPPLLGHPPRGDIFLSLVSEGKGFFLGYFSMFLSGIRLFFPFTLRFSSFFFQVETFSTSCVVGFCVFFLSSTTTTGHFEFHFQTNGIEPAESEHASEECKHLTNEMCVPFRMEKQNRLYRELKIPKEKRKNVCEFLLRESGLSETQLFFWYCCTGAIGNDHHNKKAWARFRDRTIVESSSD